MSNVVVTATAAAERREHALLCKEVVKVMPSCTPRVGDTVKLALNLAAVYELVAGEGAISPQQLADIRRKHADERYWAHVLAVELDEDRGELMLTVLSSANMRNMPAAIVSEPYEVALRNVMAVHPHA